MAEFHHVQSPLIEYAMSQGWLHRKVAYVGRRSAPDIWFLKRGVWVLIEAKKSGEKARILQAREHARLRKRGANVYVVDNLEYGIKVLDSHDVDAI